MLLEQEKDSDRSDANAQDLECSLPDGREETKVSNATCIQDDEKNEVQASDGKNKKKNRKKRSSTIEKLYEKSLRRKEAEQISRKEQVQIAEERRNIREEALAKRKHKTARMKKVNRKGQPLMQARVENILEKLEKET